MQVMQFISAKTTPLRIQKPLTKENVAKAIMKSGNLAEVQKECETVLLLVVALWTTSISGDVTQSGLKTDIEPKGV